MNCTAAPPNYPNANIEFRRGTYRVLLKCRYAAAARRFGLIGDARLKRAGRLFPLSAVSKIYREAPRSRVGGAGGKEEEMPGTSIGRISEIED